MNKKSADEFAHWLSVTHPDVFYSIRRRVNPPVALGDWSDTLSSIGDAFSSSVSAVGTWVSQPSNVNALANVAGAYFKSQTPNPSLSSAQSSVLSTQLARAQAGLSPAPISYTTDASGQLVPVYSTGGSNYGLTPTSLNKLNPSFLQKYGIILAIGGGAVLLLMVLTR